MTPLAHAMLVLFMVAWGVCVGACLYAARYLLPMWSSGFRQREEHRGYRRKVAIGVAVFLLSALSGLVLGGIAQSAGGWG